MSVSVNNYNYATPSGSFNGILDETVSSVDLTYFNLEYNVLNGTYVPFSGNAGWWGNELANAAGELTVPAVITITNPGPVHAIGIVGSTTFNSYPADFVVRLYKSSTLIYTQTVTGNTSVNYVGALSATYDVDYYTITITKLGGTGKIARVLNLFNPHYVARSEFLPLKESSTKVIGMALSVVSSDSLRAKISEVKQHSVLVTASDSLKPKYNSTRSADVTVKATDVLKPNYSSKTAVENSFATVDDLKALSMEVIHTTNIFSNPDSLICTIIEARTNVTNIFDVKNEPIVARSTDISVMRNIHTVMKDPYRQVFGKLSITYTNPLNESSFVYDSTGDSYNGEVSNVGNGKRSAQNNFFTLFDNKLNGTSYPLSTEYSDAGWVSNVLSDADGYFETPPSCYITFDPMLVVDVTVVGVKVKNNYPVDFDVIVSTLTGNSTISIRDNNDISCTIPITGTPNVTGIEVKVYKTKQPFFPATIAEIPLASTVHYTANDIIDMDLLEELTYDDSAQALGGTSANEFSATLSNEDRSFYFNNEESLISKQLKKNRKIVPYLGAEVVPGEIEWHKLGTFWSYKWTVPVGTLTAKAVGFDTIGLIGTTDFYNHTVYHNRSVGELLEIVLDDAKLLLRSLEYVIDARLYDAIVPVAWFDKGSHMAALNKLASGYPMYVSCDRDGRIVAVQQDIILDYAYTEMSDSDTIVSKDYPTLYSISPNIVEVGVNTVLSTIEEVLKYEVPFTSPRDDLSFNFSTVTDGIETIVVDADPTVTYEYEAFSWGIRIKFSGAGTVRSIVVTGNALKVEHLSTVSSRDEISIAGDGPVVRTINNDFIQDAERAKFIADHSISDTSKYDAEITYRGDISLTANDPIILHDGIAPTNRYRILRHGLHWNGGLSGTAVLNTK